MSIIVTFEGGSPIVVGFGDSVKLATEITTTDSGYANAQEELTAHEQAIGNIPTALADLSEDETHRTVTDSEIEAWDALKVVQPVAWTSVIDLTKRNTHYPDHQVTTAETITLGSTAIEGGAEVNLIGDGNPLHFPAFTGFTKASASADFNTTLNAVNFTVFYWTGSVAYYSIVS